MEMINIERHLVRDWLFDAFPVLWQTCHVPNGEQQFCN